MQTWTVVGKPRGILHNFFNAKKIFFTVFHFNTKYTFFSTSVCLSPAIWTLNMKSKFSVIKGQSNLLPHLVEVFNKAEHNTAKDLFICSPERSCFFAEKLYFFWKVHVIVAVLLWSLRIWRRNRWLLRNEHSPHSSSMWGPRGRCAPPKP